MAKSTMTVNVDSSVLEKARKYRLPRSNICNVALRAAVERWERKVYERRAGAADAIKSSAEKGSRKKEEGPSTNYPKKSWELGPPKRVSE